MICNIICFSILAIGAINCTVLIIKTNNIYKEIDKMYRNHVDKHC